MEEALAMEKAKSRKLKVLRKAHENRYWWDDRGKEQLTLKKV